MVDAATFRQTSGGYVIRDGGRQIPLEEGGGVPQPAGQCECLDLRLPTMG